MITSKSIFYFSYSETYEIGDDRSDEKSAESFVCIVDEGPGTRIKTKYMRLCHKVVDDHRKRQ